MRLLHAARARLRLLLGRRDAESRMREEMGFHVDMEALRLEREEGLSPSEARRRAVLAFGYAPAHQEAMRAGRGRLWPTGLSLDLKLGFRMLVKYPGLTLVGGLAMAFGIWAGTVSFVLVRQIVAPTLPLPGAERIVKLGYWDMAWSRKEGRMLHEFAQWREGLKSVTDLGAWRDAPLNLVIGADVGRLVRGVEISATAFRIAPESPLLGRVLTAADERPDAPPVVVLGHDVWRTRFAGDPAAVGRTVKLGASYATVVGVMREGYAFPASAEAWVPFRTQGLAYGALEGPPIDVFGRLAPGVTMENARAELETFARRRAAENPSTYETLQPRLVPFTSSLSPQSYMDQVLMLSIQLFAVLLLVLICSNVALLLFARAATRESELVVRSALGASRGRIVAQLFAEALVLGGVAAVAGLSFAQFGLRRWGVEFLERNLGDLPFWYDINVTPATVVYACLLTLLGAVVAGVVPARKITHGLGARMRESTSGGGGVRFGGVWTAVIVAQVAVTVAFPVMVFVEQQQLRKFRTFDLGVAAEEYIGVRLDMDPEAGAGADTAAQRARFQSTLLALRDRVAAEPGVLGAAFVDRVPGNYHRESWVEIDDGSGVSSRASQPADPEVSTARVEPAYFEVMGAPVLAGRTFTAADLAPEARVVMVDQGFIRRVMQGRSPVGRRLRFTPRGEWSDDQSRPWYQIVGVVKDMGMAHPANSRLPAGVYLPRTPGIEGTQSLVVHAAADPLALAPRMRELAASTDATLRVSAIERLDAEKEGMVWIVGLWMRITIVLTTIALLLSLAGIYAVLSFTVARRTREIGVRVALGAPRRRVVTAILRRPFTQVGFGLAAGFVLITSVAYAVMGRGIDGGPPTGPGLSLLHVAGFAAYTVGMLGVCLLACIVPARRALGVQPTEALRTE